MIASNRMTDLRDGEAVLRDGQVDAVALARPFLADPDIVRRSLDGRFDLVNTCIGCNQACLDRSIVGQPVSCLVNPRAGRELALPLRPTTDPKRVDVVGGGPAGLAAAVDAARRGHAVTLWEASDTLGGQFALAAAVPGKEDYAATVQAARAELHERGATVLLGRRPPPRTCSTATPWSSRPAWSRDASPCRAPSCRTWCPTRTPSATGCRRAPWR